MSDLVFRIVFSGIGFAVGIVGIVMMLTMPWAFRFNRDEIHHYYFGWLMVAVAPLHLVVWPEWLVWGLYGLGYWLLVDDWYQHFRQVNEPRYQSFCHRVLVKLLLVF